MIYSVVPRRRRYPLKYPRSFAYNKPVFDGTSQNIKDIPLPNETDSVGSEKNKFVEVSSKNDEINKRLSLTDFISKRFQTDEIILLGLIFLLLEEKINDDYLLIILTYLLITGMD